MDQQASIKDKPPAKAAAAPPPTAEREPMPRMALAAIEPLEVEHVPIKAPKSEAAMIDQPTLALESIPAPAIAPDAEASKPAAREAAAGSASAEDAPAENSRGAHRFALLAASLALAAGLGAMAGALAAATFVRPAPVIAVAGVKTSLEEMIQVLKENIVQARVELAALKVSMDGGIRNASAQFTKLGERIERVERLQGEPALKISKAVELARAPGAKRGRGARYRVDYAGCGGERAAAAGP